MVMLKFKSKVGKGSKNSKRIILPQGLTQLLDINAGDKVEWTITIENNNVDVNFKKLEDKN